MNLTPFALFLQDAATSQPGPAKAAPTLMEQLFGGMMIPILGCFAVFWFVIIRPESKQRKLRLAMLANMKKGDKVITSGGLYGQIAQIQDDVVTLQVAEGTRLRFTRAAIQSVETESSETAVEAKPNGA